MAEVARANERLRAVMDTALVGIITINEAGRMQSVNRGVCEMFGYEPEELVGRNVSLLMPSPDRENRDSYLAHSRRTGERKIIGREVVARRKDGTEFPVELSVTEFRLEGRRHFAGTLRDVSQRRRLEDEATAAYERARRELGSDLHDGLGQHLQGLKYLLSDLGRRLSQRAASESTEVGRLGRLLDEGIEQTRNLARSLRPVENAPEGLMVGLRQLARDIRAEQKKEVRFICRQPVLVQDNLVATHLFRIAQEAVQNAIRHAGCRRIVIKLAQTPDRLLLAVKDDGVGLRPRCGNGIGLHVMQYRANAVRASLVVESAPGHGTEMVCSMPRPSTSAVSRKVRSTRRSS
jgi:two-component system CheB/CheR fusion protein